MRGTGSQRSNLPGTELQERSLDLGNNAEERERDRVAQAWEQRGEGRGTGELPCGLGAPGRGGDCLHHSQGAGRLLPGEGYHIQIASIEGEGGVQTSHGGWCNVQGQDW